jgi:hypothetical protein
VATWYLVFVLAVVVRGIDGPYSKVKVKLSCYRPLGFQEVEAPEFLDSRHRKVVRLAALCTDRLYP